MKRTRGRPKLNADAVGFREEIARQLRGVIDRQNLKVKAAAEALGVSRQAFYQYLCASATPHPETIARAMDLWKIELSYKGERISRGALGDANRQGDPPPKQLSLGNLFDVPQECHNENVIVTLKSSQNLLHVTIRMKKADLPPQHPTADRASAG